LERLSPHRRDLRIPLPAGLTESAKIPEPIFTPSTKAEQGVHDENISYEEVVKELGPALAGWVRDLTLEIYKRGAELAAARGIIIADTKFEFGLDPSGAVVWIDEALTPDSSRFWPMDSYRAGGLSRASINSMSATTCSRLGGTKNLRPPAFLRMSSGPPPASMRMRSTN